MIKGEEAGQLNVAFLNSKKYVSRLKKTMVLKPTTNQIFRFLTNYHLIICDNDGIFMNSIIKYSNRAQYLASKSDYGLKPALFSLYLKNNYFLDVKKAEATRVGAVLVTTSGNVFEGNNGILNTLKEIMPMENKIMLRHKINQSKTKRHKIKHAEIRAIEKALEKKVSLDRASIVINTPCCKNCANKILEVGIKNIYYYINIVDLIKIIKNHPDWGILNAIANFESKRRNLYVIQDLKILNLTSETLRKLNIKI